MPNVSINLMALHKNVETICAKAPTFIPVIKANAYAHGSQAIKWLTSYMRSSPVFVHDVGEAYNLRLKIKQTNPIIIQSIFSTNLPDNSIPVLSEDQLHKFDTSKPFAVFSGLGCQRINVAASLIPKNANLVYVFYHTDTLGKPFEITDEYRKDLSLYRDINPAVIPSVGSSVDACLGSDLAPRVGMALFGYNTGAPDDKSLVPVKTVDAQILAEVKSSPSFGYSATYLGKGYVYVLDIGSYDNVVAHDLGLAYVCPDARVVPVYSSGAKNMKMTFYVSDKRLEIGTYVQMLGTDVRATAIQRNLKTHGRSMSIADILRMGNPE